MKDGQVAIEQTTTNEVREIAPNSTTVQVDEGDQQVAKVTEYYPLFDEILENASSGFDQQRIVDFLAKPVLLTQGNFNTQAALTQLSSINLPEDILAKALMKQKIVGYLGFRYTAIITVQVNANKFQQGRLIAVYSPLTKLTSSVGAPVVSTVNTNFAHRTRGLRSLTQLPNVQLDLACDTTMTMEIPYVQVFPYFDTTTGRGHQGAWALYVYSQLRAGTGSSNCEYTVWGSFKDVKLITPTYSTYFAESGKTASKIKVNHATDKESWDNHQTGIISAPTKYLSQGLAAIGKMKVPMLSEMATGASWVSELVSRGTSVFGFSKPQTQAPNTRTTLMPGAYMQNFDGEDTSACMGITARNQLTTLPGFAGNDIDELDIPYLTSQYCFKDTVNWSTGTAVDTLLYTTWLSPGGMQAVSDLQTNSYGTTGQVTLLYESAPVTYLAPFFRYWRGSFKLRIKAVKTTFHSGRLMVVFAPQDIVGGVGTSSTGPITLDQSQYCHREIIDFRDANEWEFLFPYTSILPYRDTDVPSASSSGIYAYGVVQIFVLNTLVAPSTCASSIDLLFEWATSDDFEFAVPSACRQQLCVQQSASLNPQSGERSCQMEVLHGIAGSQPTQKDQLVSQYCNGERITSLSQLLKRNIAGGSLGLWQPVNCSIPCAIKYDAITTSLFTTGTPNSYSQYLFNCDYVSLFGAMFAFRRGSYRLKTSIWHSTSTQVMTGTVYAVLGDFTQNGVYGTGVHAYGLQNSTQFFSSSAINQCIETHIPAYQQSYMFYNTWSQNSAPQQGPWEGDLQITYFDPTGNYDRCDPYRSVGDDFAFGFFLGTPILTLNVTGS